MEQYATRHTPGPWNYGFSTVSPLIEVYKYSDDKRSSRLIAEVLITKGAKDNDLAEADARLIAKSPDLLDMLETLIADIDSARSLNEFIIGERANRLEGARALVAVIEGGA